MIKYSNMKRLIVLSFVLLINCTPVYEITKPTISPTLTAVIDEELSLPSKLPDGIAGAYFPHNGGIVCFDKWICLHEIGHKLDYEENNRFSETKEWAEIVDYYREEIFISTGNLDKIEDRIYNFPGIGDNPCNDIGIMCWGGYVELYASILEHSRGVPENTPEYFREYYDWERVWELQKDYTGE